MRYLYCHVEEPSMEALLETLLPPLVAERAEIDIINHGSKDKLLKDLPQRFRGYQAMSDSLDLRILVLVDRDDGDCRDLKYELEKIAATRSLSTISAPHHDGTFLVVNRIVVEELEAWFFGDLEATRSAYPRLPETLLEKSKYRDPDAIRGGTWEALHREMQACGYYAGAFPKIEVARSIAPYMLPARNRSGSFRSFMQGLEALL